MTKSELEKEIYQYIEKMAEACDFSCVDNIRFAATNDAIALLKYEETRQTGCCGFFDDYATFENITYRIGCNYGH